MKPFKFPITCLCVWLALASGDTLFAQTVAPADKVTREKFDSCVTVSRKLWQDGKKSETLAPTFCAYKIALQSDGVTDDIMTSRMLGQIYSELERVDSAEFFLNQVLILGDTSLHGVEIMKVYNLLGMISTLSGKYDKALRFGFLALDLANSIDPKYVPIILHNIGFAYYKLDDTERSIFYSSRSLKLKKSLGSFNGIENTMLNLALAHLRREEFDQTSAYLDSVFSLCKSQGCERQVGVHASLAAGMMHLGKGNPLSAVSILVKCEQDSELYGYTRFQLDALRLLSDFFIKEGQLDDARTYLQRAVGIMRSDGTLAPDAREIYDGLADLYGLTGEYELAFKYKELAEKTMEDAQIRQQAVGLMRVEGARIEREYKQRLEDRDRLLALQAGMVSKQRALNIVLGIAAVLAAALAFVLWRGLLRKKRIAHMLDRVVQSRTREIIERVRLASRAQEETAIRTSKARQELNLAFANIQQLCVLAATEETAAAVRDYLETVSDTAKQAANRMTLLLSPPAQDWDGINGQHFDTGNKPAP